MPFQIKVIAPYIADLAGPMLTAIVTELRGKGKDMTDDLKATTESWTGDVPNWDGHVTVALGKLMFKVSADGQSFGARKWRWLNQGTGLRWAVMTRNFVPKTRHRYLGSDVGEGGPWVTGRRLMTKMGIPPKPGIPAREWTEELTDKYKKDFADDMQKRINSVLKKRW